MKKTIRGKLVAVSDGVYTNYVFQNLMVPEDSFERYITVTKCPNWEPIDIKLHDIGFLEYEFVQAGENYINADSGKTEQYKYTTNYFMKFIKEEDKKEDKVKFRF